MTDIAGIRVVIDGQSALVDLAKLRKALQDTEVQGKKTEQSAASLGATLKNALAIMGSSYAAQALVRTLMQAHDQAILFEQSMRAVSSSTLEAQKNIKFATDIATRMGINLSQARAQVTSFSASVKGTALEGDQARKILESVALAGSKLGVSGEAMSRAFMAISQMASKGVISMEELRQQLGEALPGSIQAMQRAMKMTTTEFNAFVTSGKAISEVVLPKMADELLKTYRGAEDAAQGFKTFGMAITAIKSELQLLIESGVLAETTTGGDWKAVIAGYLEMINMINSYLKSLRMESDFKKTLQGQYAEEKEKLQQLREEYNQGVSSYFTTREELGKLRTALEDQIRVVNLLMQAMREAKVPLDEFAGAQNLAAKAAERATQNLQSRQAMGIGGGAPVNLVEQAFGIKSDWLRKWEYAFNEVAAKYELKVNWLYGILRQESTLGTTAYGGLKPGPSGEVGAMQVTIATGKTLGYTLEQLQDDYLNVEAAGKLLRRNLDATNGNLAEAIRMYNGSGEAASNYSKTVMGHIAKIDAASGQQEKHTQSISKTTSAIQREENAIVQLKKTMASATSQDVVARLNDEVQAREKLLNSLKSIESAEISLSDAQQRATQQFYELLKTNPITGEKEKEIALRDYVIKQTTSEVKAVQDAQGAYQQLQKDVQIDAAIDANVRALKDEKDALEASSQGAKAKAEAQEKLAKTLDELLAKQEKYVESLQKEAIAAQDDLLKAQDPAAYQEYVRARERAVVVNQELISTYEQEALAALEAKYAAEDALESLQMRQGWANSILQGFDQLWSNMISGAENAMDALKKTLKSWLYAIGQWLLKQAIIIPITAKLFNVSEKSLGGGLLGAIAGNQGDAGGVLGLLTDLRGESQKTAENTGNTVRGLGGVANTFGGLISGLAGGLWQFLAAILTALTTGNFAKAGESMTQAGSSIMGGMSGLKDLFGKGAWSFGTGGSALSYGAGGAATGAYSSPMYGYGAGGSALRYGAGGAATGAYSSPMYGYTGSAGGGAQIGAGYYGLAGVAGYFGANALYKGKGYSGAGGSLGAMGGMKLGAMYGSSFGPWGTAIGAVVGAIAGAVAGGKLGSMFGGEKVTGGTAYWNPKQGAGAAHGDTDAGVVNLMGEFGKVADQLNTVINQISGRQDNLFGGGFWMDTNSKGEVSTAYNSWLRGTQKADFTQQEEAATWLANQMLQDVTIAMRNIGGGIDEALQGVFGTLMSQVSGDMNATLQALQQFAEAFPAVQQALRDTLPKLGQPLQAELINIAKYHAKSLQDIMGLLAMAQDVQAGYADSLWSVFEGTRAIQGANEDLLAAYQRGSAQFVEWRNAVVMLGGPVLRMTKETIIWSDQMARAAGGLENLQALHATYFENFYTDEERALAARKLAQAEVDQFNATLGRTGDAALDTRAELRQYVESLDLGTEAGRNAYVSALKLAEAILALDPAAESAAEAVAAMFNTLAGYTKQQLKPGDDTQSQAAAFFENFYTESEKTAAQLAEWNAQIAAFNTTLGLSGDTAIDTKDELRAYIESLDLTQEADRAAYAAAMKLVEALLGISAAAETAAGDAARAAEELAAAAAAALEEATAALQALRDEFASLRQEWQGIKQNFADILNPDTRTSGERLRAYGQDAMTLLEGIKDGWDEMELEKLRGTIGNLASAAQDAMAYLDQMEASIRGLVSSALESRGEAQQQKFLEYVGTLAPEKQTEIYKQQAKYSYQQGLGATDLGTLERAIGEFAENAGRYIDSLTDPQQKAWAEVTFEHIMLAAQEKAEKLAEEQREKMREAAQELKDRLIEAFREGGQIMLDAANTQINAANASVDAANTQLSAANTQLTAANTPIQVDVAVTTTTT